MKILNLEQRSDEWFHFREGKISGSKAREYASPRYILKEDLVNFAVSKGYDFPKTLTIAKIREMLTREELDELDFSTQLNDSIYKLIAERIAKPINANDYAEKLDGRAFSMAVRGEILEAEAREKIAEKLGKEIIEGRVWQADFNENIICSPDGEIANENGEITEAVEIKCLDSWKCVKAFYEQKPPTDYTKQITQYFVVNEDLEKLYFAIYSDAFALTPQLELQIFEIRREDLEEEIHESRMMEIATLKFVEQEVEKLLF